MPFDCPDWAEHPTITTYRERRERAAAFWRAIPKRRISLDDWSRCALGHLGQAQFDGWDLMRMPFNFVCPAWNGHFDVVAAAVYFGLPHPDALDCFVRGDAPLSMRPRYRRWLRLRLTGADFGRALLAKPYITVSHAMLEEASSG